MASRAGEEVFVQRLTKLLKNYGDSVLSGTSTLSLLTVGLQVLHQLFEQHLLPSKYQHGFVALPSHPLDTASVLDVQFLFDVLQKTISLKLVHPPGPILQTPVRIFAFKSLRFLELKRIPPYCLEGLRGVYTMLEILVCSHCINTIKEIISVCGGDLSSALPWLDLHTLNFSNNFITSLDGSLGLLNVLRTLDLSHNQIRDCAENLKLLSELEYVNLSYNVLEKVPVFHSCSRVQLVTLLLRNNELEDISGLEQLSHLRCLDLAYNMVSKHVKLASLSHLHGLKELFLEGNPVYYLKNHRAHTIYHLSPKAAFMRLVLDGEPVTMAELAYLPKSDRLMGRAGRHSPRISILKNVLESSVTSDHNDCVPSSDSIGGPLTRKKSKVKVRAASISEPSDSDLDVGKKAALPHMVLQHQEDLKKMDELRGQIGDDWLRYQHYLNSPEKGTGRESTATGGPAKDEADTVSIFVGSGSLEDASGDSGNPSRAEEVTLTTPLQDGRGEGNPSGYLAPEDGTCANESVTIVEKKEEEPVRDVCQPFIVGRVVEEEPDLENSWIFLRVTEDALLEVDLMNADILERLELSTLTAIRTAEQLWESRGQLLPTVECCFSYIRRDKRKRKYVIMDTNAQEASQNLVKILTEVLEAKQQSVQEAFPKLQCLKCRHEFEELQPRLVSESPAIRQEGVLDRPEIEVSSPVLPACPKCASDHVIILPTRTEMRTSTPILAEEGRFRQDITKIRSVDSDPTGSLKSIESLSGTSLDMKAEVPSGECTTAFSADPESYSAGKSASFYLEGERSCSSSSTRPGSRMSDSSGGRDAGPGSSDLSAVRAAGISSSPGWCGTQLSQKGSTNSLNSNLSWSYRYSTPVGSTLTRNSASFEGKEDASGLSKGADFNLSVEDFQTIDHRLKLFLDVEIFNEDKEEYQCFVKASTVKFGSPEEYASLLIMSNFKIYILEITGLPSGQPSNWLRKREVHLIRDLVYLQVGLHTQSIGMEFDSPGSSYTLLIRNPSKCKNFIQYFTDMVRELTPRSISKLKSISFTRMNPQHKLWTLIQENPTADSTEDKRPSFLYALAFLLEDDVLAPVTMLATSTTLHLLAEDHQWKKVSDEMAHAPLSEIPIKESQPISSISSISLYNSAPQDVQFHIYHEVSRTESTWHLRMECVELVNGLVEWAREYWEDMFGVPLKITIHQVPD